LGAGKTSLAKILERRLVQWPKLRGDPPHVICWFNAWIHNDAPHLGAAFAADVAKSASRSRPWWWRFLSPLPAAMLSAQERWRRRALFGLAALAVASVLAAWVPGVRDLFTRNDVVPEVRHAFGARLGSLVVIVLVAYAIWTRLFAFGRAAASFVDDPRSEAARGSMQDVSGQLGSLVRQATLRRRELRVFGRVVAKSRLTKRPSI
jgi:hypothetical protein